VLGGLQDLFSVPVIDTFGMTEAATQIAANPLGRRKLGSVGKSAGAEIAILDGEGRSLTNGKQSNVITVAFPERPSDAAEAIYVISHAVVA